MSYREQIQKIVDTTNHNLSESDYFSLRMNKESVVITNRTGITIEIFPDMDFETLSYRGSAFALTPMMLMICQSVISQIMNAEKE